MPVSQAVQTAFCFLVWLPNEMMVFSPMLQDMGSCSVCPMGNLCPGTRT